MIRRTIVVLIAAFLGFAATAAKSEAPPPIQPKLGMQGELARIDDSVVPSHPDYPNRGMKVLEVTPGLPAARLGLERGDIVVSIDSMRFTDMQGYLQALRCAGQKPSLIIVNVRNGQLVRRSVHLPHQMPPEEELGADPPHSYLVSIDLREDMDPRQP